jgi:CTP synthase
MVVEFARNVCGLKTAHTTEVNPKTKYPVIDVLQGQKKFLKEKLYGNTMRLGDWRCEIKKGTITERAYRKSLILERHCHRYEVNPKFHKILQKNGLVFSGIHSLADLNRVSTDYSDFMAKEYKRKVRTVSVRSEPVRMSEMSVLSPKRSEYLVEIIELPESIHPFFLGTQFHPELKSRFLHPHPLFVEFIKSSAN